MFGQLQSSNAGAGLTAPVGHHEPQEGKRSTTPKWATMRLFAVSLVKAKSPLLMA